MAAVALTVISSVVVTNIYRNNISNFMKTIFLKIKAEPETNSVRPSHLDDPDERNEKKQREPIDMEKYCKEQKKKWKEFVSWLFLTRAGAIGIEHKHVNMCGWGIQSTSINMYVCCNPWPPKLSKLSTIFGPVSVLFWPHYNHCKIMTICASERSGPKLQNEWSFVKIG